MTTQTTLAEEIANRLFANGAARLVLERPDGRNMGGWCREAVIDQINDVFSKWALEAVKNISLPEAVMSGNYERKS